MIRLDETFYMRDVLVVAPELIGKLLVKNDGINTKSFMITEVEAYKGIEDLACHASKGRTARTEIMFQSGGHLYVYFIYGMYWMLNIVTGPRETPEAVLIRGLEGMRGPGIVAKNLGIDKSYYGENICKSDRIWVADAGIKIEYTTTPRIGINYAGEPWVSKPWRFLLKN